ncbi:MAG: NAD(+) diphosphatase [Rhodoferax sp.]|nr:NAD(+) diphosphatase [Rhodoferax sp.]
MTPFQPGFSGSLFDRADHLRGDAAALAALLQHPQARLLQLQGFDPALTAAGALVWERLAGPAMAQTEAAALILLGLQDGVPHFVALQQHTAEAPLYRTPRTMQVLAQLGPQDMATYGTARSLIDWHGRHRFCGKCGGATLLQRAGWGRRCSVCDTEHFPRVDPVVIMLAEYGERVLLGRQASWPPGRYSALAGFLEPGETMEEAVARELFEEAGVRAAQVRYITSQAWPFPAQLMLACLARVDSEALRIDTNELEHAQWFSRAQVRAALAGDDHAGFLPPPAYAVAHSLLQHWAWPGAANGPATA